MKRIISCAALSLALVLPGVSEAHGFHGGPHFGGHGFHHGGGNFFGNALALPFIAGAAVIGTVAAIATAPLYDDNYGPPQGYYPQQQGYYPQQQAYYPPPQGYYPPQPTYYGPPPGYYGPRY